MESRIPSAPTNASARVKRETAHRVRLANFNARHVTTLARADVRGRRSEVGSRSEVGPPERVVAFGSSYAVPWVLWRGRLGGLSRRGGPQPLPMTFAFNILLVRPLVLAARAAWKHFRSVHGVHKIEAPWISRFI